MKNYLLTLALVSSLLLQAQPDLSSLHPHFEEMVKTWNVPAMSIGIVKDGKTIFTGHYGVKEVGSSTAPDDHTLYAIASNSKAFTSTMIGMLVQEGKLDWDDKVKEYVPYFEVYDPWVSQNVTIRDLLCHRVGLGTFSGDIIWYKSNLTAPEIIKRIKYLEPAYGFRSGYGYSNLMFITAGLVIEKVTGKSWSENVQEMIFEPLKMDRSICSANELEKQGNFATPHAFKDDVNVPIDWENWEHIAATGGVISSIDDMMKWMIFNLNHGVIGEDTLLTKATRNTLWTTHNNFQLDHTSEDVLGRNFNGYGLGWNISQYFGNLIVGHSGGYSGMLSLVSLLPEENIGVVVLTNGMQSPMMPATLHAFDLMLERTDKRDWSQIIFDRVAKMRALDGRIQELEESRVLKTKPSVATNKYAGTYKSDIYGKIQVKKIDETYHIQFEHSPDLNATLDHWHHDTWRLNWTKPQPWFDLGTVEFETNQNMEVTGLSFYVPNDDIFFEELKPYRISD